MTTDEFDAIVRTGSRPRSIRRPGGCTPRWSTSRCSSCSPTCKRTDSRPASCPAAPSISCACSRSRSTASRRSRSSAASSSCNSELRDGKPVLLRLPALDSFDDKEGQADRHPSAHRPPADRRVRQFRRRSADAAVVRGTAVDARFCLFVRHTDDEREFAYDKSPMDNSRQGSPRSQRERLHGSRHEERLEDHLPVPEEVVGRCSGCVDAHVTRRS